MYIHETKIADTPVVVVYETEPEFHIHDILVSNETKYRFITRTQHLIRELTREINDAGSK